MDESLDRAMRVFQRLISRAWNEIEDLGRLAAYDSLAADWLQASWETLVEASLEPSKQIHLEVYGDGADCNDRSSRILRPDWIGTHRVICLKANDLPLLRDHLNAVPIEASHHLVFDRFVTMRDGWYYADAPFDCVLVDDRGTERVFDAVAVVFGIEPITID